MDKQADPTELTLSPSVQEALARSAAHLLIDPTTKKVQPWLVPAGTKMLVNVFEYPKEDENDDNHHTVEGD